jgi:hypothetical protein
MNSEKCNALPLGGGKGWGRMKAMGVVFIVLLFAGCDANQEAKGIVLDEETHRPIAHVAITRQAAEDYEHSNFDWRKVYSDSVGVFHFHAIGITNKFDLYFSKEGYWTRKVKYGKERVSDTVYLKSDARLLQRPSL